MKNLIIAAAAALTLTCAQAQDCKVIGDLAETIMKARQTGVTLSEIISLPTATTLGKRMAIDAYKRPRFSTDEFQQSAITDFRAEWEVACYEVRSKKGGSDV